MSTESDQIPPIFQQLAPGVGTGSAPTAAWRPITECPLLIFVGVTGVGKSTTLEALAKQLSFQLLPNRRVLTDDLIIAYLQQQAGQQVAPVTDRAERFALTRRYRAQFPGGMGHALSCLLIQQAQAPQPWLVFDGLRGVNEVSAACTTLPDARFVVLDAPDVVRVQRLLGRSDSFDQVTLTQEQTAVHHHVRRFADIGLPEADALFSPEEVATLLTRCVPPVGQGNIAVEDLRAKLKIVTEERQNYDPQATLTTLQTLAANRTLLIDTTKVSAKAAATAIATWLAATDPH